MKDVDKTISSICDWIQKNLRETGSMEPSMILPELTKALAELVTARAVAEHEFNR